MSLDDIYTRSKPLRLAIFDVDGVLTDGGLHYSDSGEETKVFDVRDGLGMRMLQASGIALAIITSRTSGCVAQRARDLGIELLFQGVENKLEAFEGLVRDLSITPAACAYMGDDWVDLPVLLRCGLAISVPEAPQSVQTRVHYVTRASGGQGAAREACEMIMHAQGTFDAQLARFISRAEPTP